MIVHKFHDVYDKDKDVTLCGIAVRFENTTKKDYHVSCKSCRKIMANNKRIKK